MLFLIVDLLIVLFFFAELRDEHFMRGHAFVLTGRQIIGFVFFDVLPCLYAHRGRITIL